MATKRASSDRKRSDEPARPAKRGAERAEEPAAKSGGGGTAASTAGQATSGTASYVVFARRFRPRSFSEVVGQTAATGALRQALTSGRLAQAYLFCGPRGIGKTSLARIVAKALNCKRGAGPNGVAEEPCNECEACVAIHEGRALDVIEMDAATNRGIEEVRALRENVGLAPAELRFKVYIIDEVHMLTREAWNAFLKTLEEPPGHVKFIFATTDPNNVPETILSRCQRFDLRRIGPADIVTRLKQICGLEKIEFEEAALSRIASLAKGGLRDAESLLDQAVNLGQGNVTDAIVRQLAGAAPDELVGEMLICCAQGKSAEVLGKAHQALEAGADPEDLLAVLSEHLRGALLAKVCGPDSALLEGQAHLKEAYAALGKLLNEDQILMLLQLFGAARRQMRDAAQTRLPLEMALIHACQARDLVDMGRLVGTLETLAASRAAAPARPPDREGARPNLPGRPAGTGDSRPAAISQSSPYPVPQGQGENNRAAPAESAPKALPAGISGLDAEGWSRILAAVGAQKGGALLTSALTHAQAITFDPARQTFTLGFGSSQLFYRDVLEKPQNNAALLAVLQQALGEKVTLVIERMAVEAPPPRAAVVPPSRAATPPAARPDARAAVPARAPVAAEGEYPDEAGSNETEIEFDDADALPLRGVAGGAVVERPAPQAASGQSDEEAVPPPVIAVPKTRKPVAPPISAADAKALEAHPLVQAVLKETGGVVVGVTRK